MSLNGDLHETTRPTGRLFTHGLGPLENRTFLLVTLPSGPFGLRLAEHLRAAGANVSRTLLNGGDFVDWGWRQAHRPKARREAWPVWLARTLDEHMITDVIVFGDSMHYSATALKLARERRLKTWVLENGYSRPDWVTLEPNGVNANSCISRDPRSYDDVDTTLPVADHRHVGTITPFHTLNMTRYFTGVVLGTPFFSHYRFPYATPLWDQIFGHIRRYARSVILRGRWDRAARQVIDDRRPFFLACLQREGDSQLLEHSDLKTNRAFMAHVIASFARAATSSDRLVFKNHPLDPGIENLSGLCSAIAAYHGVSDRISFLESGAFAPLARASRGIVAVNSTAAYAALGFGTPVKLLGRAVFDVAGLADGRPLDSFWRDPIAPDQELFARFRRRLSSRTQVFGSYHNPAHLDATAQRVVQHLVVLDADRTRRDVATSAPGHALGASTSTARNVDNSRGHAPHLQGRGRQI